MNNVNQFNWRVDPNKGTRLVETIEDEPRYVCECAEPVVASAIVLLHNGARKRLQLETENVANLAHTINSLRVKNERLQEQVQEKHEQIRALRARVAELETGE